eukprot:NODE_1519_length_1386_cov_18.777113_g1263_i0.p1 GENE.NODE_1519_length_1386_cov_18.777113_g1263_i0~~NODE_1519_length_1386_cov_18.777113_g1263_i0.p1  ORF type:complete len:365 (+),score=67.97 NODE_1519_length_1386_cov_18.777113_g1263_i0:140-1234(+)
MVSVLGRGAVLGVGGLTSGWILHDKLDGQSIWQYLGGAAKGAGEATAASASQVMKETLTALQQLIQRQAAQGPVAAPPTTVVLHGPNGSTYTGILVKVGLGGGAVLFLARSLGLTGDSLINPANWPVSSKKFANAVGRLSSAMSTLAGSLGAFRTETKENFSAVREDVNNVQLSVDTISDDVAALHMKTDQLDGQSKRSLHGIQLLVQFVYSTAMGIAPGQMKQTLLPDLEAYAQSGGFALPPPTASPAISAPPSAYPPSSPVPPAASSSSSSFTSPRRVPDVPTESDKAVADQFLAKCTPPRSVPPTSPSITQTVSGLFGRWGAAPRPPQSGPARSTASDDDELSEKLKHLENQVAGVSSDLP